MQLPTATRTGSHLDDFFAQTKGMNDPGTFAPDDSHAGCALRTLLRIAWKCSLANSAEVWHKRIAVRALISPGHQFKAAEGAIEVQRNLAVGTYFILFANGVSATGAKSLSAMAAKAILQEYRCFA